MAIAVGMGLVIAILACLSAWRTVRQQDPSILSQAYTRYLLRCIDEEVAAFARSNQAPPHLLSELGRLPGQTEQGEVLDAWRHPFVYTVNGTNHMILSYGRDGRAGGIGLDCDLSNGNPRPPEALPTLGQFLFDMPVQGMLLASVIAGVLTFLLSWVVIQPKELTEGRKTLIVTKLVITLAAALFVASIMTAVHIPSGH